MKQLMFFFIIIGLSVSCTIYESKHSTYDYETTRTITVFENPYHINYSMPSTVQGLFIGVSHYNNTVELKSTPAHSLSALLMMSLFSQALDGYEGRDSFSEKNLNERTLYSKGSKLTSIADLKVHNKIDKKLIEGLSETMKLVVSKPTYQKRNVSKSGHFNFVGNGRKVTKERILRALEAHLQYFSKSSADSEKLFVFYISAHGAITQDGRSVIFPEDVNMKDQESWLEYDEVLKLIYKYRPSIKDFNTMSRMLIVFDTCNFPLDGKSFASREMRKPPFGVTIVTSSSPGEYSYHWMNQMKQEVEVFQKETSGISISIGKKKSVDNRLDVGTYNFEYSSKMSALPVAFYMARNRLLEFMSNNKDQINDLKNRLKKLSDGEKRVYTSDAKGFQKALMYYSFDEKESWRVPTHTYLALVKDSMHLIKKDIGDDEVKQNIQIIEPFFDFGSTLFTLHGD